MGADADLTVGIFFFRGPSLKACVLWTENVREIPGFFFC